MENYLPYCNNLSNYSRFQTREVAVGDVRVGGGALVPAAEPRLYSLEIRELHPVSVVHAAQG